MSCTWHTLVLVLLILISILLHLQEIERLERVIDIEVCVFSSMNRCVYLTLGAHALEGYSCHSVRPSFFPSVCLSVTTFSPATRNKTAKKRYQRVQCRTAILVKMLRSKVMASQGANMQISTGLPRPALRTLEAQEFATQDGYRLPRAI